VEHLTIPVVGNGDVWYAADALRMRAETGCSAVMIGRPALRNPWIFRQIAQLQAGGAPCAPDATDVMLYVEAMRAMWQEHFPERLVVGMLKEQMRYLCRVVDPARGLLRRVLVAGSAREITDLFAAELRHLSASDLDLGAQPGRFEQSGSALPNDRVLANGAEVLRGVFPGPCSQVSVGEDEMVDGIAPSAPCSASARAVQL
jgi:hypothetical protein